MQTFYITKAVELVQEIGLDNLSREVLSDRLQVPAGSFSHTMGLSYKDFLTTLFDHLPFSCFEVKGGRLPPSYRKQQVLAHAVKIARDRGYWAVRRKQVADKAGVSEPTVSRLFTLAELRQAIVQHAITTNDEIILAQAKAARDPLVIS